MVTEAETGVAWFQVKEPWNSSNYQIDVTEGLDEIIPQSYQREPVLLDFGLGLQNSESDFYCVKHCPWCLIKAALGD